MQEKASPTCSSWVLLCNLEEKTIISLSQCLNHTATYEKNTGTMYQRTLHPVIKILPALISGFISSKPHCQACSHMRAEAHISFIKQESKEAAVTGALEWILPAEAAHSWLNRNACKMTSEEKKKGEHECGKSNLDSTHSLEVALKLWLQNVWSSRSGNREWLCSVVMKTSRQMGRPMFIAYTLWNRCKKHKTGRYLMAK